MLRQVASSSSSAIRRQASSSPSSCLCSSKTISSSPFPHTVRRDQENRILTPPQWSIQRYYGTTSEVQGGQPRGGKDAHDVPPHSIHINHNMPLSKQQRILYATRDPLGQSASNKQRKTPSNVASSNPLETNPTSATRRSDGGQSVSKQSNSMVQSHQPSHSSTSNLPSPQPQPPKKPEPTAKKTIKSRIVGVYIQLKFLFQFYFNGVKQIWRDRKRVVAIRQACRVEGGRQQTWAEARLVQKHSKDLRKLPLFLAILLILEEILPLIVIYAPFLLPSTCILPSQMAKIRQTEEIKRAKAVETLRKSKEMQELMDVAGLPLKGTPAELKERLIARLPGEKSRQEDALKRWRTLGKDNLISLSRVFCLPTLGRPSVILRSNLESHLLYVARDDALLFSAAATRSAVPSPYEADSDSFTPAADLPLPATSSTVAAEVLSERGLRASGYDHDEMQKNLQSWLDLVPLFVQHRSTSSSQQVGHSTNPAPSLSLRQILLPLSLYPPPSLFTPSLREMELRQEGENEMGIVAKSKGVVDEIVKAREGEIRKEREKKAQQAAKS